ncbi:hypothetical protein DL768_011800 [Monosporascus sp. mg162]|nr:hypothetical protein DL768_011800 [Monosporascus sp. mg162]
MRKRTAAIQSSDDDILSNSGSFTGPGLADFVPRQESGAKRPREEYGTTEHSLPVKRVKRDGGSLYSVPRQASQRGIVNREREDEGKQLRRAEEEQEYQPSMSTSLQGIRTRSKTTASRHSDEPLYFHVDYEAVQQYEDRCVEGYDGPEYLDSIKSWQAKTSGATAMRFPLDADGLPVADPGTAGEVSEDDDCPQEQAQGWVLKRGHQGVLVKAETVRSLRGSDAAAAEGSTLTPLRHPG